MNKEQRAQILDSLFKAESAVCRSKGEAYAGNVDVLDNFKRNAKALGLSKYQVWAVYFGKHIDSIVNAIKANPEFPIDRTEGMEGRLLDARTYLGILQCMIYEDTANTERMGAAICLGTADGAKECEG